MSKLIQFKGQITIYYLQKYYESLKENILSVLLACYHVLLSLIFCNMKEQECAHSDPHVYLHWIKYKWHIYMVNRLIFKGQR